MPDFDWQQLRQLAGEDTAFEAELLQMFVQEAESSLRELESAITSRSIKTIEEVAHSLRGASANVGASALAVAASRLEAIARNGQIAEANSLLQQLQAHCQKIQTYVANRL